ncbi:MAG: VOC family protein [Ginsengibacter sp.]
MKFKYLVFLILFVMCLKQAEAQNKPRINHIAVYIHDLGICTNFYKDVVGLEVIPEPFHDGRHTWFSVGDHAALHLIAGAKGVESHLKDSHLCFSVDSIETFISVLEKNNVAYENWVGQAGAVTLRADGIKQIYFKDPEGYWIEVNNDQ